MKIEEISLTEVLPLRQEVLWPSQPLEFSRVPDDERGLHFGIRIQGELVCVASVFIQESTARLRKFATKVAYQGQGVGSAMLRFLIEHLGQQGVEEFWFDARVTAVSFYQKFGFAIEGPLFYKHEAPYYKMTQRLQTDRVRPQN